MKRKKRSNTERARCCEPRCRNRRRKDRRRCDTCDTRRKRAANPMRAAYRALKDHAKERGIPFTISFAYFRYFAIRCDYVAKKGLHAGALTVDRKDNLLGYVKGNIQPMSRAANSLKRCKSDAIRMKAGYSWMSAYEEKAA